MATPLPTASCPGVAGAGGHPPVEVDDVGHEGGDPRARRGAEDLVGAFGQVVGGDDAGANRVVDVVVEIGQAVGDLHDLAFERPGDAPPFSRDALAQLRMLEDAVADLLREIQAAAVLFEDLDHPHALLVVAKAARQAGTQRIFARVTKRGVSQVVPQGRSFGQILVQIEAAGDRSRDLHDLHRVRQARAVVVAHRRDEDLGFVFEATEGLGVDDAVAIDLVRRPHRIGLFRPIPIGTLTRAGREFGEKLLAFFRATPNFGVGAGGPVERVQRSVGVNPNAACAAARRAIGMRPGAQLT